MLHICFTLRFSEIPIGGSKMHAIPPTLGRPLKVAWMSCCVVRIPWSATSLSPWNSIRTTMQNSCQLSEAGYGRLGLWLWRHLETREETWAFVSLMLLFFLRFLWLSEGKYLEHIRTNPNIRWKLNCMCACLGLRRSEVLPTSNYCPFSFFSFFSSFSWLQWHSMTRFQSALFCDFLHLYDDQSFACRRLARKGSAFIWSRGRWSQVAQATPWANR